MTKKLFFSQVIYLAFGSIYFFLLRLIDIYANEFDSVLFKIPRYGLVLFIIFFVTNLFKAISNKKSYSLPKSYDSIFLWLTFLIFLAVTAVVYFQGFTLIGAPFKYNVFVHLLIPHTVAYFLIKYIV